jgi:hypothetical protein
LYIDRERLQRNVLKHVYRSSWNAERYAQAVDLLRPTRQ